MNNNDNQVPDKNEYNQPLNEVEETDFDKEINIHLNLLQKNKIKFFMYMLAAISVLIFLTIIIFFINEKKLIGLAIGFSVLAIISLIFKYGNKNINNTYIKNAICINKKRCGYRKQYFEYTFQTDDDCNFEIKTSQKEKFKKDVHYTLLFRKRNTEDKTIYGNDLIAFEMS